MFALLLLLYRNKEQRHLNTQGRLHQELRKDPVKGLTVSRIKYFNTLAPEFPFKF